MIGPISQGELSEMAVQPSMHPTGAPRQDSASVSWSCRWFGQLVLPEFAPAGDTNH